MEALAERLPLLVNIAIAAMVFALGLNAQPSDITFLWKQPGLLLRSLIAVMVVVPVAAVLVVRTVDLPVPVVVGILAMATCPGAPFAPQKQIKLGGRLPYVYSLLVAVTLFALITIPLTITILRSIMGAETESLIAPRDVARITAVNLLLPLAVGVIVRRFIPSLADRIAKPVATVVNVFFALLVVLILVKALPLMLDLGGKALAAMAFLTLVALAAGHLLGGPVPEDRSALAITASLRHPGLALLIGKVDHPGAQIGAVVISYLLVTSFVAIPYNVWRKRLAKHPEGNVPGELT